VDLRDPEKNYHKFERAALTKLVPTSIGTAIFDTIAFPGNETRAGSKPEFSRPSRACLSPSSPVWALTALAPGVRKCQRLSAFVEENFSFYGKKLPASRELRPRWKRVAGRGGCGIGEDLGQLYVQKAFSAAAKGPRRGDTWPSSKSHAEGYPRRHVDEPGKQDPGLQEARHHAQQGGLSRKWRRTAKLDIARRPYVLNVLAADAFEFQRDLASSANRGPRPVGL